MTAMRDDPDVTRMPTVVGLFETHLTVSDLDRSTEFYRDVVGLTVALTLPARGAAFLWIGRPGRAMLGLWSLGSAPIGLSLHVAFTASLPDVLGACDALRLRDVTPLSFFAAETTEPSVIAWMPAAAVYFRDPDGHLIEYLAMLDAPPRPELGIVPWSQWRGTGAEAGAVRIERHTGPRAELRALFEEAEDSPQQVDAVLEAGEVLVARVAGQVVGHLQLTDATHAGASEIKTMAVDAAHRGRGIGRMLIRAAAARARTQGRATLAVATAAADVGSLRFYQRAGFRLRSVERDAFSAAAGYRPTTVVDGIPLRDRVWLDLDLGTGPSV
jgi:ribosomal protein S18 acetylase RimI-like enzyme/catechol 2,3-dioxygenase-like lactoylglutathione lyase family enzyme